MKKGSTLEVIDLDRTEVRRIAAAVQYLVEQHGSRREVERAHGISEGTIAHLIRGAQPWRITRELLDKIGTALGLRGEDVLAGRAPAAGKHATKAPAERRRRPRCAPAQAVPELPPFSAKVLGAMFEARAYTVADLRTAIGYAASPARGARAVQSALRLLKRRGLIEQATRVMPGTSTRLIYEYSRRVSP